MEKEKVLKITNKRQFERLLELMKEHPGVARGLKSAGGFNTDKNEYDSVWRDVTSALNSLGPPIRTTVAWQKVWSDLKLKTKKKLSHNKKMESATGGGTNKLQYISPLEERVINLLQMDQAVNIGNMAGRSFGTPQPSSSKSPTTEVPDPSAEELQEEDRKEETLPPHSPFQISQRTEGRRRKPEDYRKEMLEKQTGYLKKIMKETNKMSNYLKKLCELKEEKLKVYKDCQEKKENYRKEKIKMQLEMFKKL